ncbi:ent-kaur-16-ene synthase, chloroplastic-like [Fagus crenata]
MTFANRYWLQGEEDIFLDTATCAMAFRILRVNGYDVPSDPFTRLSEDHFSSSHEGYVHDIGTVLELFRASEIITHPDEFVLEKQNFWTSHFLILELSNGSIHTDGLNKYVGQEEHGDFNSTKELAIISQTIDLSLYSSYVSSLNTGNEDFLTLAVEDFNICQSIHREELKHLKSNLFSPELSDARISWAKNGVLGTVIDDFSDIGGSKEELHFTAQSVTLETKHSSGKDVM